MAGRTAAVLATTKAVRLTRKPPIDANACVQPITASRRLGSVNSSASQAVAATNSTQTPMNAVVRKKSSIGSEVENPDSKAEKA